MPHSVLQARRRLQAAAPRLPLAPPSHTSSTAALGGPTWRQTRLPDPTRLFLSPSPGDNASIAADLSELTSGSHLAGTPASAPVASTSRCSRSYPGHGSLSLLRPDGFPLARGSRGRGATRRAIVPHVRACPASGAVAEVVFVNLGRDREENGLFGFVELYISEKETDSSCDM
jgi:hypothetical protein